MKLFFHQLTENPVYYFTVVIIVIISIVLHELGHGVAAIRQGDNTPIVKGHMTWNPVKHMGMFSLVLLFAVGIAFGMMPVTPSRFRDKFGEAYVAAAGPAVNLVLAIVALTTMALLRKQGIEVEIEIGSGKQAVRPLYIMGVLNMALFLLNLLPIPPLDGSVVLGNFVPAFRNFARNPDNQGFVSAAFILVFLLAGKLFEFARDISVQYLSLFS